jgi:hypothetical protein
VVSTLRLREGAERRRDGGEVLLDRPQANQIAFERERGAVPDETVDAVTEKRRLAEHIGVRARRTLSPKEVYTRVRRKVGMEGDSEKAPLRPEVDRKVEHRRLHDPIHDPLHFPAVLFEHDQVVAAEKGNARRNLEPIDNSAERKVRNEQRRSRLRLTTRSVRRRSRTKCGEHRG